MTKPTHKKTVGTVTPYTTTWNEVQPPSTYYHPTLVWLSSTDGITNPQWKSQVEQPANATTPYSGRMTKVTHSDGTLMIQGFAGDPSNPNNYREAAKKGWLDVTDGRFNAATSLLDNTADNIAAGKFYKFAASSLKALEGGELLGELRKTAAGIVANTRGLISTLSNWRRTMSRVRFRNWRQASAYSANAYLEWKFGWDPLASDIKALATQLKDDNLQVVPVTANGNVTYQRGAPSIDTTSSMGLANYDISAIDNERCAVRYMGAIAVYRYGCGGLAERLGISPNNFLPTAYNLLPWTYMIDYFTNLGEIVQALAFPESRIIWCCRTVRNERITKIISGINLRVFPGIKPNPGYPIALPSVTEWSNVWFSRASATPPIPGLYFRLPSFQTEGGRTKWLNVAAVIATKAFGNRLANNWRN